jgi:hypothetical protein
MRAAHEADEPPPPTKARDPPLRALGMSLDDGGMLRLRPLLRAVPNRAEPHATKLGGLGVGDPAGSGRTGGDIVRRGGPATGRRWWRSRRRRRRLLG